jgi:hypothetical protein
MCVPRRPPSIGFVMQLTHRSLLGFETQTKKPSRWFWGQNHQTRAVGFEASPENPSEWFWGQTTHKPSTLVLRLNHETRVPRLHVHGADRTWRHPTSRSPGHRVPDLCDHPRSSAPGLLLLPQPSSLHVMPHLPPAHHKTSKRDSPNETKIKQKQKQTHPGFEFKPRQVNDSSQSNQGTDHLISQRQTLNRDNIYRETKNEPWKWLHAMRFTTVVVHYTSSWAHEKLCSVDFLLLVTMATDVTWVVVRSRFVKDGCYLGSSLFLLNIMMHNSPAHSRRKKEHTKKKTYILAAWKC